eukprot:TRINITY_DN3166_c0_g1_i2.p1 TRINITY_DN3166_c0_g1~~TRINITY_DN3166_c0_g1_i2.p1  ORF type:complete len:211 (+),score=23.95 TRINITY_DN3166_c0_g1_i2:85-717(+)
MLSGHVVWQKSSSDAATGLRGSSTAQIISDSSQSSDMSALGGKSPSQSGTITVKPERSSQPEDHQVHTGRVLGFRERGGRELVMPELHVLGLCSPCYFTSKGSECAKGDACSFCHMHWMTREGAKSKPRKSKRAQCGSLAAELEVLLVEDPDTFVTHVIDHLWEGDTAVTAKIKTKLRKMINSDALNDEQFQRLTEGLMEINCGGTRLSL